MTFIQMFGRTRYLKRAVRDRHHHDAHATVRRAELPRWLRGRPGDTDVRQRGPAHTHREGSGTSFYDADGIQTVAGTPIHLISRHGTVLIDAGLVTFADELDVRGPLPSLFVPDLAPYDCPA